MKIHLINNSKQSIGGGWTFLRTFEKYLRKSGIEISESGKDADVILISGATMADREFVELNKSLGKKIVFRIDNVPRNSRNRNTGTSRLFDFAQMADLVIYQSQWAKNYILPFVKKDGPVILNGADTDIFRPDGTAKPKDGEPQYLYAQFNRDETKQFHQAWYQYLIIQRNKPKAHLWLAGQFSPELQQYNFDFFMGEKFQYCGIIDDPEDMAEIYRGADALLLPYFNDACSQTLIEFINCQDELKWDGCIVRSGIDGIIWQNGTGGNKEILEAPREQLSAEYMTKRYLEKINGLFK